MKISKEPSRSAEGSEYVEFDTTGLISFCIDKKYHQGLVDYINKKKENFCKTNLSSACGVLIRLCLQHFSKTPQI